VSALPLERGEICYSGVAGGAGGIGKAVFEGASGGYGGAKGGADDPATPESDGQVTVGADGVESGGWYSVSPDQGILLPGEKLEIIFTALVSEAQLQVGVTLTVLVGLLNCV